MLRPKLSTAKQSLRRLLLLGACAGVIAGSAGDIGRAQTGGTPPVAPVRPVTDDYYGTKVVDPYRYMENVNDPEVQAWMKAQNDYTRAMLN